MKHVPENLAASPDPTSTPEDLDVVDQAMLDLYGPAGLKQFNELYQENSDWPLEAVIRRLSEQVISTQTQFYREPNLWSIATGAIPMLQGERPNKPIGILEIGCANGKESYSLAAAILANGHADFQVTAVDVNPAKLEAARLAEYKLYESFESLMEQNWSFPQPVKKAGYFEDTGRTWSTYSFAAPYPYIRPSREVLEKVTFQQHDIIDGPVAGEHDLALINNVLVHYPDATRDTIMRHAIASLSPGSLMTFEAKMIGRNPNEVAWLKPYHAWRDTMPERFGLTTVQPPNTLALHGVFYRTPEAV
jgi:chemotaxis methyl-accepting protein methylase